MKAESGLLEPGPFDSNIPLYSRAGHMSVSLGPLFSVSHRAPNFAYAFKHHKQKVGFPVAKLAFWMRSDLENDSEGFDPNADYIGWAVSRYAIVGDNDDPDDRIRDKLVRIGFTRVDNGARYLLDGFVTSGSYVDPDSPRANEKIPGTIMVARIFGWDEVELDAHKKDVPAGEDPEDYCLARKQYFRIPVPSGLHLDFFYEDVIQIFHVPLPKQKEAEVRLRSEER